MIEGASYALAVDPDPKLDAYVDGLIAKIAAAQEPDGYIYTTRTINPQEPHRWARPARWVGERDDSHELYDMGHLIEAAVAHNMATGKTNFLNVATKAADLLVDTFGPGKRTHLAGPPNHRDGARAAVSRSRARSTYLDLAKFLLDERGPTPPPSGERVNPRGLDYNQAQVTVIDQTEPVGHAVRAMYMYSGMADVAALTGDDEDARRRPAHLGQPDQVEAVPHGRHRRGRRPRRVRRPVRAAEHDGLQRDLRVGRHGLLEPAPVPAATATRSTWTSWSARSSTA